jgi:hypothetical protein
MADRDPRANELHKFKLALATFAIHLDAFEASIRAVVIARKMPEVPIKPDVGLAIRAVSAMSLLKPGKQDLFEAKCTINEIPNKCL